MEKMMNNDKISQSMEEEGVEVDLKQVFLAFKKKWWLLLLSLLIGGAAAGVYSKIFIEPTYTSASMVYVLSKETTISSLADFEIGTQLTQDYKVLIRSRTVMEQVIKNLGLDMGYASLKRMISIDNPKDTRILSITVESENPYMSKSIVDEVAKCSATYISEIMEMDPPKIVESGEVAAYSTKPNVKNNAILGGIFALFFVSAVLAAVTLMDDSIKTEEDVEQCLELPVLAVLPACPENHTTKQRKRKKSR
ncbi:Wzz/FepE/Etk N-terminal domain-containing protein [Hungatella hathewayi]|uniref:YveK family protein n=1 Tax=Hungatella hathewayi TaxID=154046 RepID=UPI00210C5E38|nr:Wzz/FepE/Etk N-terminal domain-containing protein [Hungatella hathewayi]MCQ5387724.1 Wzz/FepE/Etk N-terminal domain-containing protein [Hungatella hathewayi]